MSKGPTILDSSETSNQSLSLSLSISLHFPSFSLPTHYAPFLCAHSPHPFVSHNSTLVGARPSTVIRGYSLALTNLFCPPLSGISLQQNIGIRHKAIKKTVSLFCCSMVRTRDHTVAQTGAKARQRRGLSVAVAAAVLSAQVAAGLATDASGPAIHPPPNAPFLIRPQALSGPPPTVAVFGPADDTTNAVTEPIGAADNGSPQAPPILFVPRIFCPQGGRRFIPITNNRALFSADFLECVAATNGAGLSIAASAEHNHSHSTTITNASVHAQGIPPASPPPPPLIVLSGGDASPTFSIVRHSVSGRLCGPHGSGVTSCLIADWPEGGGDGGQKSIHTEANRSEQQRHHSVDVTEGSLHSHRVRLRCALPFPRPPASASASTSPAVCPVAVLLSPPIEVFTRPHGGDLTCRNTTIFVDSRRPSSFPQEEADGFTTFDSMEEDDALFVTGIGGAAGASSPSLSASLSTSAPPQTPPFFTKFVLFRPHGHEADAIDVSSVSIVDALSSPAFRSSHLDAASAGGVGGQQYLYYCPRLGRLNPPPSVAPIVHGPFSADAHNSFDVDGGTFINLPAALARRAAARSRVADVNAWHEALIARRECISMHSLAGRAAAAAGGSYPLSHDDGRTATVSEASSRKHRHGAFLVRRDVLASAMEDAASSPSPNFADDGAVIVALRRSSLWGGEASCVSRVVFKPQPMDFSRAFDDASSSNRNGAAGSSDISLLSPVQPDELSAPPYISAVHSFDSGEASNVCANHSGRKAGSDGSRAREAPLPILSDGSAFALLAGRGGRLDFTLAHGVAAPSTAAITADAEQTLSSAFVVHTIGPSSPQCLLVSACYCDASPPNSATSPTIGREVCAPISHFPTDNGPNGQQHGASTNTFVPTGAVLRFTSAVGASACTTTVEVRHALCSSNHNTNNTSSGPHEVSRCRYIRASSEPLFLTVSSIAVGPHNAAAISTLPILGDGGRAVKLLISDLVALSAPPIEHPLTVAKSAPGGGNGQSTAGDSGHLFPPLAPLPSAGAALIAALLRPPLRISVISAEGTSCSVVLPRYEEVSSPSTSASIHAGDTAGRSVVITDAAQPMLFRSLGKDLCRVRIAKAGTHLAKSGAYFDERVYTSSASRPIEAVVDVGPFASEEGEGTGEPQPWGPIEVALPSSLDGPATAAASQGDAVVLDDDLLTTNSSSLGPTSSSSAKVTHIREPPHPNKEATAPTLPPTPDSGGSSSDMVHSPTTAALRLPTRPSSPMAQQGSPTKRSSGSARPATVAITVACAFVGVCLVMALLGCCIYNGCCGFFSSSGRRRLRVPLSVGGNGGGGGGGVTGLSRRTASQRPLQLSSPSSAGGHTRHSSAMRLTGEQPSSPEARLAEEKVARRAAERDGGGGVIGGLLGPFSGIPWCSGSPTSPSPRLPTPRLGIGLSLAHCDGGIGKDRNDADGATLSSLRSGASGGSRPSVSTPSTSPSAANAGGGGTASLAALSVGAGTNSGGWSPRSLQNRSSAPFSVQVPHGSTTANGGGSATADSSAAQWAFGGGASQSLEMRRMSRRRRMATTRPDLHHSSRPPTFGSAAVASEDRRTSHVIHYRGGRGGDGGGPLPPRAAVPRPLLARQGSGTLKFSSGSSSISKGGERESALVGSHLSSPAIANALVVSPNVRRPKAAACVELSSPNSGNSNDPRHQQQQRGGGLLHRAYLYATRHFPAFANHTAGVFSANTGAPPLRRRHSNVSLQTSSGGSGASTGGQHSEGSSGGSRSSRRSRGRRSRGRGRGGGRSSASCSEDRSRDGGRVQR